MIKQIFNNYDAAADLHNSAWVKGFPCGKPLRLVPIIHGADGWQVSIMAAPADLATIRGHQNVMAFLDGFCDRERDAGRDPLPTVVQALVGMSRRDTRHLN